MMNHELDFDTFVEDPSNHLAYSLCKDIAESLGRRENPVWIHGPAGCGKSHLLEAIRRRVKEENILLDVCATTGEEVTAALMATFQGDQEPWERLKSCDMLLMDHMDCVCGRPTLQREIAELVLDKCDKRQQVLLASSYPPGCFTELAEAFYKQAEMALFVDVAPPSPVLCRALVSRYLEHDPFPVTDTALTFLVDNARSFAQLRGALNAALFWHQTNGKKVTLWWVKKYMRATVR